MNVDEIDFKHLRLLEAIYRKRSLSEAARSLDIPQPTASHALARLRLALKDDLVVKARGGMEPTPRLTAIIGQIGEVLNLKRMIADGGSDFAPERLEREFVIACSDVGQLLVSTIFAPIAQMQAPFARYRVVTLHMHEMILALENGDVDLALGAFPELSAGINVQALYTESYRCFGRPEHPFIQSGTMEDYRAAEHVVVSTKGLAHAHRIAEHTIESILEKSNMQICVSSFLVGMTTAARLNLIVTSPGKLLEDFSKKNGLVSVAPPFDAEDFQINQYWHSRENSDIAHKWLRKTMFQACRQIPDQREARSGRHNHSSDELG